MAVGCAQVPDGDVADTVYTNGRIYTVNEAQPWAEAVAIKDGKFLVVGSNAEVEAVTGDDTDVVDLGGGFAMPGIGYQIMAFPTTLKLISSTTTAMYCERSGAKIFFRHIFPQNHIVLKCFRY